MTDQKNQEKLLAEEWRTVVAQSKYEVFYHGTHTFGEQNPNVKLTDERVRLIRARFQIGGERKANLARLFGVSDVHIHKIVTGQQRFSAGGYL